MNRISVKNVCKIFNRNVFLKNINLELCEKSIVGLIGQNGSGKTVLMKCICGLLSFDKGEINIGGKKVGRNGDIPPNLGIMFETSGLLPYFSGFNNLKQLAAIRKKIGTDKIKKAMEKVGLSPDEKMHVVKYSLGMKRKLCFAQAIMEDPDILILDEPMNGLEESATSNMMKLLLELRNEGKTILISSHSYTDISAICDEIYEMNNGKLSKFIKPIEQESHCDPVS